MLQECELCFFMILKRLTRLSLLGLSNSLHIWVDRNHSHVIDGVRIQVPQGGAGGAS